jgi:hypothetical protein
MGKELVLEDLYYIAMARYQGNNLLKIFKIT